MLCGLHHLHWLLFLCVTLTKVQIPNYMYNRTEICTFLGFWYNQCCQAPCHQHPGVKIDHWQLGQSHNYYGYKSKSEAVYPEMSSPTPQSSFVILKACQEYGAKFSTHLNDCSSNNPQEAQSHPSQSSPLHWYPYITLSFHSLCRTCVIAAAHTINKMHYS